MLEQISTPEVLKWVAVVFLAGFIGFFGKFLGKVVISLFQRKKHDTPPARTVTDRAEKQGQEEIRIGTGAGEGQDGEMSRQEQKLLKKALKNESKARKKSEKQ